LIDRYLLASSLTTGNGNIADFGVHVALFGCLSLSQSLADSFFKLVMVANPRFALSVSVPSVIVSEV